MDCSMPDFPLHHQLLEPTQTHVHWINHAIQPSHPLSSPSPPAFNLSQHQHFQMNQVFTSGCQSILLEGTNKTLCTPGPRRKEQRPHKRLTQICLWVSRSLWQRCGSAEACCRVQVTECGNMCMGPFEGGRHYLHLGCHSWASGQTIGRKHSHEENQQKIGLEVYWTRPRPSEQDPVSPSVSLYHQEASISLLSSSIREKTMKTTIIEN